MNKITVEDKLVPTAELKHEEEPDILLDEFIEAVK